MEKRKVRFTMTVTKDYEIDLTDYQDMGSEQNPEPPCQTIDEAAQFDCKCIKQDPFAFIDDENTEIEVKYEVLEEVK